MGRALGDTPITTVTTELDGNIGASVQVRAGGELRLGNDAYESAVQAGAIFKDSAPKLIISQPITLTSAGSLAVGADISAEAGGAAFGKDSQFVVNFAQLSNAPAITGQGGNLVVEPGAEIQVNVTGIQKGRYLITKNLSNAKNMTNGSWSGGWKENLILIPREMVASWQMTFGSDGTNTWIDTVQDKRPDVAAPDVASDLLDEVPPGPAGQIAQNLLNGENGIDPETAKRGWNSLVNLGFAGGQMAAAYTTLTGAADAVQNRGSMIAEGFNKDGRIAHKTRTGDAWIQLLGTRERVKRYNASHIPQAGYELNSSGFIGGLARNFEGTNALAGIALSYQIGKVKSKENLSKTDNRFYTFGAELYGNWSPNPLLNVVGDLGYYYNQGKVGQTMILGSSFSRAQARIQTNMMTIGARLESTIKVGRASVIPHVGVRYVLGKTRKYTTKLDGKAAFTSSPKATDTWQFPLGISVRGDITTRSGWKIRPTADVSVILQAGDKSQSLIFGSPEISAKNMLHGRFTGNSIYIGRLGLQMEKGNVTYGIRYGYSRGGFGKSDHEIKVEAIWRF